MFGAAGAPFGLLIEEQAAIGSFHFGIDPGEVTLIRGTAGKVLGSATTATRAKLLENLAVDAVIR